MLASCVWCIINCMHAVGRRYKHLGQFATFGSGQAGVELPGDWVNVGKSTQWLWYSVYARYAMSPCYPTCRVVLDRHYSCMHALRCAVHRLRL